ncbi:CPCC family cysteine-rich protein [Clostridium thermarum]|uniref:CPCC family cysteine-rich protein n=1 Tax=Clostridium thermarum TaxID=1716543 RepID=UPI0013D8A0BA|nr:CPCC family cysteine-rich protein [Clostridium thermarum]
MEKYACPCCGYKTLTEEPPGTFDICRVCFWEDDDIQYYDPDFAGGANGISLREAQKNFEKMGACKKDSLKYVRKPKENEARDEEWAPLE